MNFLADRYSKKYFIALLAGQLAGRRRICPSNFHLLSIIVIDKIAIGSEFVILYSFLLDILCGHFIPTTLRSCFYENCSSSLRQLH